MTTDSDDVPMMLIDPPYDGDIATWEKFLARLLGMKGNRAHSWLDHSIDEARAWLEELRNPAPAHPSPKPPIGIRGMIRTGKQRTEMRIPTIRFPEKYRRWANVAAHLGFTDFISSEDGFRTELGSGRAWTSSEGCGIYFWIAEDGETYVGRSVNVRSRLLAHWRKFPDLTYACFQTMSDDECKTRERLFIHAVEKEHHFPTRNIKEALQSEAHVPFDNFVTADERRKFLLGDTDLPDSRWRDLALLQQKHAKKYADFCELTDAKTVRAALASYISRAIPKPAATEVRFWSVSLFVQNHIVRVNAGHQEVLTISRRRGKLTARVLSLVNFGWLPRFSIYQTRSYDVGVPVTELDQWLTAERLLACRELVVRLMRHTTTLNSGSHCPQLVRTAFN